MRPVTVIRDRNEKQLHRALLQFHLPRNRSLVRKALIKAGRQDLIALPPKGLVPPAGPVRNSGKTRRRK
jgi:hypothetical protein